MKSQIITKVTKKQLTLIPDSLSEDNEFDVKVINGSNKFTSFQIELTARGLEEKSDFDWYKVEPAICTKNPPGSETDFHIAITKPPIPAYDSTIDLILTTFSIEDEKLSHSQKIRLKVESPRKNIDIQLPVKIFRGKPGEKIEIPVTITNISPHFTDIKLELSGLENFEIPNNNLNLQLKPTTTQTINVYCKIPQQPTKTSYNFQIAAISQNNVCQSYDEGNLEILSYGIVEFECHNSVQNIPNKDGEKPNLVCYELEFTNHSYSRQQVNVNLVGKDVNKCDVYQSENVLLKASDNKKAILKKYVRRERPWFGWKRQFKFAISPYLHSGSEVEIKSQVDSETLTLNVSPIIPLFLQFLGLLSIPLLFLFLNYLRFPGHTAPVTSVRLTDIAGTVISGSSDRTIRRWQVNDTLLENQNGLKHEDRLASESEIKKAVRVIRFRPKHRNQVAVGLENGEIQIWDLSSGKLISRYLQFKDEKNRVFDLDFTDDAQTLIAAYGGGQIRQWNLDKPSLMDFNIRLRSINSKFTISTLGISENNKLPLVVVAGRYNNLGFWDWQNENSIYRLSYKKSNIANKNSFQPILGKESYITSLIVTDKKNFLITADNKGLIKTWNLNKIRECIINQIESDNCEPGEKIIHDNKNQEFPSIRSIAITEDESYLASAGDDGYIRIWQIKSRQDREFSCIYKKQTGAKLNTVDIKLKKVAEKNEEEELLIATGDDNFKVKLYRENINQEEKKVGKNANCN
ncbi:MAG: hypothetical protein KI793_05545 [Rivularia sp. (in: Bacteria)]|nr:hypothetical protein [Rivularia sp. MS3]